MIGLIHIYTGRPRRSYKVLKGLIFVFPFIRLLERSYFQDSWTTALKKSPILDATEFFQILDKYSFKDISKPS